MIYNDFKGLKLSAFGMGNMRLPVLDGSDGHIDVDSACEMNADAYIDPQYGIFDYLNELLTSGSVRIYCAE